MIWMDGGPSHYETFDPKPDAPAEIRGTFKSIPDLRARRAFQRTGAGAGEVLRQVHGRPLDRHKDPNHGGGNHYMMTGAPTPVPVGCGAFVTFHPSFGSMVSYDRGVRSGLPAYMAMPSNTRSGGPNFLGGQHAPFVIGGDPNANGFQVRDVVVPADITEGRAMTRRELRASLDRMQRFNDKLVEDPAVVFDQFYQQGFDLVSSSKAQAAFDISREDAKVARPLRTQRRRPAHAAGAAARRGRRLVGHGELRRLGRSPETLRDLQRQSPEEFRPGLSALLDDLA